MKNNAQTLVKFIPQFLSEVRTEMSKVEWPKFDEFVGATIITFVIVVIFSLFFGVIDKAIELVIKHIFTYGI